MTAPGSGGPGSAAPSASPGQLAVAGWQAVLAAEHAAIYGYGVLGVHLTDPAQVSTARALEEAHRDTRDALMSQLAGAGATPVAAQASYSPEQPVVDAGSAQRWAARLEQACAAGYRYVLTLTAAATPGAARPASAVLRQTRSQALTGLTSAAVAMSGWQALITPSTPTVPFPGA